MVEKEIELKDVLAPSSDAPEVTVVDESKLNAEQQEILKKFKEDAAKRNYGETIKAWEEAMVGIENIDDFVALVNEINACPDLDKNPYMLVDAVTLVALAAVRVVNKEHVFPVDLGFRLGTNLLSALLDIKGPYRIYEFEHILDPACDGDYRSIPPHYVAWLRNKAKALLEEQPDAPAELRKRWKQVMQGNLPEGWVVRKN